LKGVLNTGREKLFGLSTQAGDNNAWVPLGKAFEGYTLKSYDEAKSSLLLERDGRSYELALATAKIATAEGAKGTAATLADAAAVIDQMHVEEMFEKMMTQQKKMIIGMTQQQMGKRLGGKVDPREFADLQGRMMDVMVEALNPAQMKQDITEIYAQTFSKEELAALGNFYATPAGVALINKQPEVQQKLQAVMMPRVMAAMPKIQQMGVEFGQQQQAKAKTATDAAAPSPSAPASVPAQPAKAP